MQVSYNEGLATYVGLELWLYVRKGMWQALAEEVRAGYGAAKRVDFGMPRVSLYIEGNIVRRIMASVLRIPRGRRPHARTEAFCTKPGRSCRWPRPVGVVGMVKKKVQP